MTPVNTTGPQSRALSFLSLFTSFGTLICCALPSLLVVLGLGATVASFLSAAPWLVMLSRHKAWAFAGAGALIGLTFLYVYALAPRFRAAGQACAPDDPAACATADRVTRVVLPISAALYAIGLFTAYALAPMLAWLD
jgi:mercuric ion transport protein